MKFIESGHFDCQFVGGSVFVGILQLTAGFLLTVCWLVLPDESPGEEPHCQGGLTHPAATHHCHPQSGKSLSQTRPEISKAHLFQIVMK